MSLAGIPDRYQVSVRVRSQENGLDAGITEHGGEIIEAGTALAAFAIMLTGESCKGSWLRCSPEALKSLLGKRTQRAYPNREGCTQMELDVMGWDSHEDGGDSSKNGYPNDWNVSELVYDEDEYSVDLDGTSCMGDFEFEIRIAPVPKTEVTHASGSNPPVKDVTDLSRSELEEIVKSAQEFLFVDVLHDDGSGNDPVEGWWPGKDVSGADFVEHMTGLLSTHGLMPAENDEIEDNCTTFLKADGHWVPEDPTPDRHA